MPPPTEDDVKRALLNSLVPGCAAEAAGEGDGGEDDEDGDDEGAAWAGGAGGAGEAGEEREDMGTANPEEAADTVAQTEAETDDAGDTETDGENGNGGESDNEEPQGPGDEPARVGDKRGTPHTPVADKGGRGKKHKQGDGGRATRSRTARLAQE